MTVGVDEDLMSDVDYAQQIGQSLRWVRDHAGSRYGDIACTRVGRNLRFSAADRAENRRRFALASRAPAAAPDPRGPGLPTDPRELARLVAEVRRLQHA